MRAKALAAASVLVMGVMAGCGGSGSGSKATAVNTVSGKVADGYLANATVFLDKNRNYQLDQGEPSTVTDQLGAYKLAVAHEDIGKFPLVVLAVKDVTVDLDDPGRTIANSFILSLPASAVSGTVSAFISPMSTLLREKLEAHPEMSLLEAMAELRTQMNLPAGMDVMADYLALGSAGSTDANRAFYQLMHTTARNMASLMAAQAHLVLDGTGVEATTVDVTRFRAMMGSLNVQLSQMVTAMQSGAQQRETMMNEISQNVQRLVDAVTPAVTGMPFRNMTSLFPRMSGIRFWNMTGHPVDVYSSIMGWMRR